MRPASRCGSTAGTTRSTDPALTLRSIVEPIRGRPLGFRADGPYFPPVLLDSHLPALRSRNFRLLWMSQIVSMAGSMMQSAAILWHVSLLVPPHHRGLALGMVGAVRIVPVVVFSMLAGVIADHFDRRRVMVLTQGGMALAAAGLAAFEFAGGRALWPVYVLAALSSAFW